MGYVVPARDQEELAYSRLNILLANDALAKLDYLKDKAGLASRGRTIQELINIVWETRTDSQNILALLKDKGTGPEKVFALLPFLANIIRRLGMFHEEAASPPEYGPAR